VGGVLSFGEVPRERLLVLERQRGERGPANLSSGETELVLTLTPGLLFDFVKLNSVWFSLAGMRSVPFLPRQYPAQLRAGVRVNPNLISGDAGFVPRLVGA